MSLPAKAPAAPTLDRPIVFGKYQLVRLIGRGGMGEVYLGREEAPSGPRAVVVKKIIPRLARDPHFVGRFLDELSVAVQLRHPNIAHVFEMGQVETEYFLAMEYVQGKTLSRLCRRLREEKKAFPLGLALWLAERVCDGLSYAHVAKDSQGRPLGLVHRDLSPSNVCVSYRGEVKIIDFGAAQSSVKVEVTAPGTVIGNLAYMAPEQARRQTVGPQSDVYAVGAMLWELSTGVVLKNKGNPLERWHRAAHPNWQVPSKVTAGLPAALDDLVMRALREDPTSRYPSAAALGEALRSVRAIVDPRASELGLVRLLASVYAQEQEKEARLLKALLPGNDGGTRRKARGRDDERTAVEAPPTALAFEHAALEQSLYEDGSTESRTGGEVSRASSITHLGFGVSLDEASRASLVVAVEGDPEEMTAAASGRWSSLHWTLVSLAVLVAGAILLWKIS